MAISNRSQMHVLYLFNVFLSDAFNDDALEQNHHYFVASLFVKDQWKFQSYEKGYLKGELMKRGINPTRLTFLMM